MRLNSIINRLLVLLALSSVLITGCDDEKSKKEWTVLIYMGADNSLSYHVDDEINEIERTITDMNIVIQVDRSSYNSDLGTLTYEVKNDSTSEIRSKIVRSLGETDSGDWENVAEFMKWGYSNYPSQKKAFVIWSHGNGWSRNKPTSVIVDDESNSMVSVSNGDFRRIFSEYGGNLDILLMDVCLMQTIEVLGEVQGYADYVIGSEAQFYTDGYPYDEILSNWDQFASTEEIAENIADKTIISYLPGGSQHGGYDNQVTCSVADMGKYNDLMTVIFSFTDNWSDSVSVLESVYNSCRKLDLDDEAIDMNEFFGLLYYTSESEIQPYIENVITNLDNLFVYKSAIGFFNSSLGYCSIYYPSTSNFATSPLFIRYRNLLFNEKSGWDEFLIREYE